MQLLRHFFCRTFPLFIALQCIVHGPLHALPTQPSYFFLGQQQFDGVQIYDVIQDDQLDYWIATDNGIYKYDSYNFTRVECPGVQSPAVFGFVKNQTGTIYCYNLNNQIIQIEHGQCSVLYELKPEERSADLYLSITPRNELLVFTKTVLLFDEAGIRQKTPQLRLRYYGFPFVLASGKTISHIADCDSLLLYENRKFSYLKLNTNGQRLQGVLKFFVINGNIYAITSATKDIYRFNESNLSLTLLPPTALAQSGEPFRIYPAQHGVWAAGVMSGVRLLSGSGTPELSETFYPQFLISDVFEDAEGNLLFSTFNHGMLVVPDITVPDVLNIPQGHAIMSIQHDDRLGMLMGTITGKLLSYQDGSFKTLSESGSRPLQAIFSWPHFPFAIYDDGNIKALNKVTGEIIQLTIGSLKDAIPVGDSVLYLAMNIGLTRVEWKGGNTFICKPDSKLRLRCYAVEYAPSDQLLYVATSDGLKTMSADGTVEPVIEDQLNIFANDISYCGDLIYVASGSELLTFFKGKLLRSVPLQIQNDPAEPLKLQVQDNIVNVITSAGFARFDLDGNLLAHLNTTQGFSSKRIYDFDLSGSDIWICHTQGIQQLNAQLLGAPVSKPLIRISSMFVNDQRIYNIYHAAGIYDSDQNKFVFSFSSPTLKNKENIRYHYQLTGYDDRWIISDYDDHEVVYNALAPGTYTLTVKAENRGVFSEPVSTTFSISAPFYSTWWFIGLVSITLLLIVNGIYRFRLRAQERKAKLINELHASRLTAIQSQMNPHFIFNSLNSIQDLVLKGDVDNSYTFITKFSNLVRRTLNYSDKDFVEFSQEIKLLELYLSLEKLRFKDDLEFTLNTEGIEDIMIPPMLIQPFIENALLHGLLHKEGKKKLSIRFHLSEHLTCIIEDNGIGREKAKEIKNRQRAEHESFAGQAIKKRFSILSRIFQRELGYTYADLYEGGQAIGTRVILTIPVKRTF